MRAIIGKTKIMNAVRRVTFTPIITQNIPLVSPLYIPLIMANPMRARVSTMMVPPIVMFTLRSFERPYLLMIG